MKAWYEACCFISLVDFEDIISFVFCAIVFQNVDHELNLLKSVFKNTDISMYFMQ